MKCKLLVAEDELIERKVLCKTLQKYLGDLITLYEAKNGREAIEIFEREAPQAAILDIEMPGANGLEVARKIRETDKNCAILFLTGYDKFAYARQAISVRALDYLLKPLSAQGIMKVLRRAKEQGDYLIVALSTDEFNWEQKQKKSYFSYEDRKRMLEAIRYVDLVIPEESWDQKLTDVDKYHVDVFVMGDDWKGKFDFLKDKCEVVYLPRTPEISTTKIKTDLHT